ncbi:MAG TPA: hypothetical protein VKO67_00220 [Smithellaceae bacterium]|nr:hypothetical protein [Smithellaceae bacterium]
MADNNENTKGFSTCLENAHFAEMMQKAMDKQCIGSLCAEMLKKAGREDGGCITRCAEMMQVMLKGCTDIEQESTIAKEANHAGNK